MIVVIFGQPHSGKTTLGKKLCDFKNSQFLIDGDRIRTLFKNTDYSRKGRKKNLEKASDIAAFLHSQNQFVVCSLVYPFIESREYLRNLVPETAWIYLHYEGERGREKFHVPDFDLPLKEEILELNTSLLDEDECMEKIIKYLNEKNTR